MIEDIEGAIEIAAPVERVWTVLTGEGLVEQWLGCLRFKPQVGHVFYMQQDNAKRMRGDISGAVHCAVETLEPPNRFVFSWYYPDMPKTRVTVTLEATSEGTRASLVHTGCGPVPGSPDPRRPRRPCRRLDFLRPADAEEGGGDLAGERAPADVGAVEALGPVDRGDGAHRRVSRASLQVVAAGADVEHAAAGRPQRPVASRAGSGVEDHDVRPEVLRRRRVISPPAFGVLRDSRGRPAPRRPRPRRARPAPACSCSAPVGAGQQVGDEVALQPQHQHLAFRVAEAGVELDQLGAVARWPSARRTARRDRARPRRRCPRRPARSARCAACSTRSG